MLSQSIVFVILTIVISSTRSNEIDSDSTFQPKFDRSNETVSVVVGKRALLPCYISLPENKHQRLGSLKVIWMKVNSSSVLTMENRAINGDPRISLLRAYADDWSLQINDIDEDDAGIYRCFTNKGNYKSITLEVKVPPKIIDELTTEAYPSAVRTGSNLTIKCYAQGKPRPSIRIVSYDQFDNTKIISEENEVTLYNVSRSTNRRYECIASNGYPPDVARSFQIMIHYPPELTLSLNDQLVTSNSFFQKTTDEIQLKCQVQMNPMEKILWMKNQRPLNDHYQIYQLDQYLISELTIPFREDEYQAEYTCMASNGLGTVSKSIRIFSQASLTTTTSMTTTTFLKQMLTQRRKRPKHHRTSTDVYALIHSTDHLKMLTVASEGVEQRCSKMLFSIILFITVEYLR